MTLKLDGITIEQLHEAYRIAAKIVALYGDAYLPVFKPLHSEVQKITDAQEIKSIALQVASLYTSKDSHE